MTESFALNARSREFCLLRTCRTEKPASHGHVLSDGRRPAETEVTEQSNVYSQGLHFKEYYTNALSNMGGFHTYLFVTHSTLPVLSFPISRFVSSMQTCFMFPDGLRDVTARSLGLAESKNRTSATCFD